MDNIWNAVLVMRFFMVLFSLDLGLNFSVLTIPRAVGCHCFCLSGVIFYVCAVLETKQLCCDLEDSDLVVWLINNV